MTKKFSLFFSLFLFIFTALLAKDSHQTPIDKFIVGTASGYAPFVSLTPDGQYEGFDIDVAKCVAEKLNKQLVLKDLGSLPSLAMALKQGKIDAVIWAISITRERKQEINLVHYQGEREKTLPFLFWKEVPDFVQKIDNLKGLEKTVCVESGGSQESILRSYETIKLKNVDKITDAVMDVKYGKSLTVAVDPSLVLPLTTQTPQLKVKHLDVPDDLQVMGIGIGISKSNPKLTDEVQKSVEELKKEGKIAELEKKWNLT